MPISKVTLKINLGRAGEMVDQFESFDGTFTCNGVKVGWKPGLERLGRSEVFFWTNTQIPFKYHFLAVVVGKTKNDAIAKFKERYCGKAKRGPVTAALRQALGSRP